MARLARKRSSDELEPDNETESDTAPSAESVGLNRSKKQRTANAASQGAQAPSDWARAREDTTMPHQPGSIVRIKLTDFVTYTSVEVHPGPSLNMVIGPNGTGKSTMVCAICIGLGWGPQHLGRAKDVGEFVKHGCREALIEIELCADGKRFRRNPIIRCQIKRESNKCQYSLNGKPASKKQILSAARSLSIQVDNLCQFLPQDKVVEFAGMTPVELLKSTQRAIASQEMIDWHEQLKQVRKAQRELEANDKSTREELTSLESRQRMQEGDVERLRERDLVKQTIEYLEMARPIAAFRDANKRFKEARRERESVMKELQELEDAVEPSMRAVNAKQIYRDAVKGALEHRGKRRETAEKRAAEAKEKIRSLNKEIERADKVVGTESKNAINQRQEQRRLEGNIVRLKKQMEEPPPEFDVAAINDQIRELQREASDIEDTFQAKRAEMVELRDSAKVKNGLIMETKQEIESLNSKAGQQMVKLSQVASDTHKAWKWIQENQNKFQKHVFGPPLVECSLKDRKYGDIIETLIQFSDMTSLTVQTRDDFQTLHKALHDDLGIARLSIKTVTDGLDRFPVPHLDEQTMKQFGFESWAIQQLEGPAPVLAMLCESARLHVLGVALKDTSPEQYRLIEASRIQSWVTSKSFYQIRRRAEYGPSAVSTSVRPLRKAQVWTDQPVDMSIKQQCLKKIDNWQREIVEVSEQLKAYTASAEAGKRRRDALKAQERELAEQKAEKQKALTAYRGLPTRLQLQENKLVDVLSKAKKLQDQVRELENKHDDLLLDKGRAALDYAGLVDVLHDAHSGVIEADIAHLEALSDFEVLSERNTAVKQQLESLRKEVERLNQIVSDCHKVAKEKNDEVKGPLRAALDKDDRLGRFIKTYNEEHKEHLTVASLEADIDSEKAKLDLMHEGDGSIIVRFEERAKKIDKLKERVAKLESGLAETGGQINAIKAKWEPELDRLAALISDSFSFNMQQINCAGQVSIYKADNEFDDWAIQIQVKFRESEPLSQLDAHRQSGGERAVSTIFYLMSLQSLTRSPFRVVDEINQGMDPRNERLVHARMVAIATGRDKWEPPEELLRSAVANGANEASSRPAASDEDADDDDIVDGTSAGPAIHEDSDADEEPYNAPRRPQLRTSAGGEMGVAGAGGSQYFLITPKLLPGLRYEPGMRVLIITSGELMEEYVKADPKTHGITFERSLEIRKALKAH